MERFTTSTTRSSMFRWDRPRPRDDRLAIGHHAMMVVSRRALVGANIHDEAPGRRERRALHSKVLS